MHDTCQRARLSQGARSWARVLLNHLVAIAPSKEAIMAKTYGRRRYSRSASKDVERAMHKRKRGTLKSGKGGKGGTVKSRKQAIAIGLSEARKKGKKVPRKRKAAEPNEPAISAGARGF